MAVHSQQLWAGQAPTAQTTEYTVPSGVRTILKSIVTGNTHGGTANVSIYLLTGSTIESLFTVYMAADGTDGDSKIELPWIVCLPGQHLAVAASVSGVYVALSGTELNIV